MAKKLKSLNPIIGTGYKTLSTIKDGEDGNIENFPDTLPKIPRLSYKRLGVSGLEIGWEFEDKIYYTYELYGSTTKGFEASEENLMFQGLASSYFYEAKPGEKWYFKARAKNTHGRYTEFSSELVTYTVKLDNLGEYVEGGSINGALIENATINNAHIKDLHADKITAGVLDADRIGANSITANKIEANAITTEKIQANAITTDKLAANIIASNHIQSGTIESGHIKAGTIESDHIKSNSINSNHIQANTIQSEHIQTNTIQSEHIQTGAITAGSGIIAEGAIGSAQISSLDAAKIEAGTIDTSKVTIQGADGHLRLKGNRMQVFQGTGNQAKERVSLGDVNGNGSVYGLRVRGADGTTILLDENGVKSEGITDGAITNDKISDDANIDGAKLNINSVVNKINEDGTETIQGTKIEVDGTTLNTKLSTITTKQTEDSERISQAQSQITANTNAIKLKVDEQTYTADKRDMTSKLEKNTSEISAMKGQIALKVEQTDIENAKSEMEGVIDTKVDSAKAEIKVTTDAISQNVSNLSQTVSTKADGSTVTTLSNKVSSLETSVNGISGKVTNLEKTTTNLGNSVSGVQGEVETLKSDIASLEVTTSGISQKVSSVESTTATLSTQVTTAQNTANSANSNATNALNTANSANSKIDNLNISDRNLIKNSDMFITTGSNTDKCTMSDDFGQLFNNNKGKKLSISIEVNATNALSTNTSGYKRLGCELAVTYSDDTKGYFGAWQSLTDNALNLNKKRVDNTYTIPNKDIKSVSTCGLYIQGLTSGTVKIGKPKYQISDKSSDWTPAPEDIDSNLNDVKNSLNSFQNTVNTTFKDGIIEEAEAKAISQHLKTLDTEKADIDKEYSTIYSNANLTGSAKTNLASAKTSFDSAHASLKSTINTVISDGRVSSSESASVTSTFNTYNTQLGVYKQRIQEALDAIGSAKVDNVQIGGRNLVKQSKLLSNVTGHGWNVTNTGTEGFKKLEIVTTETNWKECQIPLYVPINTLTNSITISFEYQETTSGLLVFNFGAYNGNTRVKEISNWVVSSNFKVISTTDGWKYVSLTFDPTSLNGVENATQYKIQFKKISDKTGTIYVRKPMLEIGNKPSSWSPAPEDVDSSIGAVDGKVTTLQGEYNTTKSKVATLETNLDGITQRVSSTESTTVTLTTKVDNAQSTANTAKNTADSAKSQANTNKDNISTLQSTVTSTSSKVASLETNLNSVTSRVSNVETKTTTITDLAKAMAGGKILNTDAMFKKGNNGVGVYNNSNNGVVTINRIAKVSGCPTSSTHCLEVKTTGTASPYLGGFYFGTPTRANQVLITRIIAKIPTGRNISWHSNATGNGSSQKWLTSTAGTGKWEEYICQVKCGTDGSFSSTNYFAIKDGSTPTTSNPLVWHIAYATVIDITDSDESVNDLTTRMSTAESKLTKDSLTTTIGNHYTTSNDVNGIVTSKGYATTSEVKQTTNELTATFKGSGGYNLLYNGNFKRSFEKWTNTGATIANNLSCPQNQTGILLSGALTTTKHCVQSVNTETLKPFTVSFWQYTSSAGSDGTTNPYRASQITITYSDNTKTYHSTGPQTVFDTWELRNITIKPTKRVANISVELWNRDTTKSVYYTNVMLEHGSIYTEWSPNPNEVYDGVTTIDKDGIKVSQSNYNGYTQMKADGFYVNNGSENVISVTSSGATFKGKVTIQSGSSVPTSTLSGTISSNQLNSSITSDINNAKNNASSALSTANAASTNATNALNTANSVNSTVDSNKGNWSNAYNRVKEWASGAVTGTTNINGGMIATNTITADKIASRTITADRIAAGAITANEIKSGTITASMITSGTLDASKVNVTNLNASNIKSGKLSANYIDATNLSVKGELLSGQINGIGGMKFADGAVISSYNSHIAGYKGIQISAPSIKLGDRVDIHSAIMYSDVTGKNNTSSNTTTWTMTGNGALTCNTVTCNTVTTSGQINAKGLNITGNAGVSNQFNAVKIVTNGVDVYGYTNLDGNVHVSGNLGIVGDLTVRNKAIYGMGNIALARGTIYLPQGGGNNTTDYLRIGGGFMAGVSSGNFHFLTSNGSASRLYASNVSTLYSLEPTIKISETSALDQIDSVNVVNTSEGLRLAAPMTRMCSDESSVVTTAYNEETNQEEVNVDYNSAISTLWKAIQELKQENEELKKLIKGDIQ